MSEWLYTLRKRFRPNCDARWRSYLNFSGFQHICELVTLDSILCPDLVTDLTISDWEHNLHEDCRTQLFREANYLLTRQPLDFNQHQLLAVLESPTADAATPRRFERCGYDIMDAYFGNSTLTNCGPIPEAFSPTEVNQFGLLPGLEIALRVRDQMRQSRPNDPHFGNCEVWLIARLLPVELGP